MITLIIGPTSVGKTGESVKLAKESGAPVISMDRIQCLRGVYVGSGRPTGDELEGTRRIYLDDDRPLFKGELDIEVAMHRLMTIAGTALSECGQVIVEGGSISMIERLAADTSWMAAAPIKAVCLLPRDTQEYGRRIQKRVAAMVGYHRGLDTMQQEIARAWYTHSAVPGVLRRICGYREIIGMAARRGLIAPQVAEIQLRAECMAAVVGAHLAYASLQQQAMRRAMRSLRGCIIEV